MDIRYDTIGNIRTTVGLRDLYECGECGGAVSHRQGHTKYHETLQEILNQLITFGEEHQKGHSIIENAIRDGARRGPS